MREYIELGPVPTNEDCAQLGNDNYSELSSVELKTYLAQLERSFENVASNPRVYFSIKYFNHDFGRYGEIVINYDDSIEEDADLALYVDHNLPEDWDEISSKYLEENKK